MNELFVLCQRKGCGNYRPVRWPYQQRRIKYCSRRCGALAHGLGRSGYEYLLTHEQRMRGVHKSNQVRHARALQRFAALTKAEVYRLAYRNGWCAGVRRERRRQRKEAA